MFHLFSSLARTSCETGLNEPKLQSLENKVFEFEFEFEFSLSLSPSCHWLTELLVLPQTVKLKRATNM